MSHTPAQLKHFLAEIIRHDLKMSIMLWGAAGIGKSSAVSQVAEEAGLTLVDLRLSQLAPTDLRGLPVPDGTVSRWLPPEFLPTTGKGILFLDEINMAPPTVQGIAQQLILDRRVGSYEVPSAWFVFAAGNRKEDRASVFDMPAPLANRFVHVDVTVDFDSWRNYAIEHGLHERVIAFLTYRPTLLHKMDPQRPAWPSPRSWTAGSAIHTAGLDIATCIGEGAASEFTAFLAVYRNMPDLDAIIAGHGKSVAWPSEPSTKYATATGLSLRPKDAHQALAAFRWLIEKASAEWVQLFATNMMVSMRAKGVQAELAKLVSLDPQLKKFFSEYQSMVGIARSI